MRAKDDRRVTDLLAGVGGLLLLGCLLYLLVRALTGYDLADTLSSPGEDVVITDRAVLWPWVVGSLLGLGAVAASWWLGRRAAAGRVAAEERGRRLAAERDGLASSLEHERSE